MLDFTTVEKNEIAALLLQKYERSGFSSLAKYAVSIGLTDTDLSNLKTKKWEQSPQLIGVQKWVKIARIVNYQKNQGLKWVTAQTEVYNYITGQLKICQSRSIAAMFVDDAGIGKTYTAKEYADTHRNAFYVDCSRSPKKTEFIRSFAQAVGVESQGKLSEVLDTAIYALSQMDSPLVILDEAGDLEHPSLLLFKRIYNSLEDICGFYLMGADGLREKIENGIRYKKLGYVELYSRLGKRFSTCLPIDNITAKRSTLRNMARAIAEANGLDLDQATAVENKMTSPSGVGDMRKAKREILKYKMSATI